MTTRDIGKAGEDAALEYLLKKGYIYRTRNFRAARCEIDLIMMDGQTLVFIEVKARSSAAYGAGREAVTWKKQRNIIKAAQLYALKEGLTDSFIRFDVAEVELTHMGITHITDAFRLN